MDATLNPQSVLPQPHGTGPSDYIVGGAVLMLAIGALVSIWRRPGSLVGRLAWSVLVLVPLVGALAYFAMMVMYPTSSTPVSAPENEAAKFGGHGHD